MSTPTQFDSLDLKSALLSNLAELGYTEMTLVQAETLPPLLSGADVLARAKTGSGKTAAFGLGLLNKIDAELFQSQALVLCPTRELADQVAKEIRRLARGIPNIKILSLCGGVPLGPQVASLQHSPHIVVGTPGRILKHLQKKSVQLGTLQTLVLDEADRMLDMGFEDELNAILEFVPPHRQTLLFSATYPDSIAAISQRVQREPVIVDVTDDEQPAQIVQSWCSVTREYRKPALVSALRAWGGALNLVFCNTKIDCAEVAAYLVSKDIAAIALHGDLDQKERTDVLVRFANRSAAVLVATDVAARGLDVKDLDAVFNYELPNEPQVYIHRIGRTGRAGKEGVAISLVERREERRWRDIEALMPDAVSTRCEIPVAAYSNDDPAERAEGQSENPSAEASADIAADPWGASSARRADSSVAPPADASTDLLRPLMTTIQIDGGRKNKLRPGDLLGALTADGGVPGDSVGSIDLFDTCGYVAVRNAEARQALQQLATRPIKGKMYRARIRH